MAVVFYDDPSEYISSASDKITRINRLKAIITALEDAALKSAGTANLANYAFDDGQAKINAAYSSPIQVAKAIDAYTMILERLTNQLQGRRFILRDQKSTLI